MNLDEHGDVLHLLEWHANPVDLWDRTRCESIDELPPDALE